MQPHQFLTRQELHTSRAKSTWETNLQIDMMKAPQYLICCHGPMVVPY